MCWRQIHTVNAIYFFCYKYLYVCMCVRIYNSCLALRHVSVKGNQIASLVSKHLSNRFRHYAFKEKKIICSSTKHSPTTCSHSMGRGGGALVLLSKFYLQANWACASFVSIGYQICCLILLWHLMGILLLFFFSYHLLVNK